MSDDTPQAHYDFAGRVADQACADLAARPEAAWDLLPYAPLHAAIRQAVLAEVRHAARRGASVEAQRSAVESQERVRPL